MHGSTEATDDAKIAGIVEQVRSDMQGGRAHDTELLLRQRFGETGLQVSEEEIARLVADIRDDPSVAD